jgi:hypothetical protein
VAVSEWSTHAVDRLLANTRHPFAGRCRQDSDPSSSQVLSRLSFANSVRRLRPVLVGSSRSREGRKAGAGSGPFMNTLSKLHTPRLGSQQCRRLAFSAWLTLLYHAQLWFKSRRQGHTWMACELSTNQVPRPVVDVISRRQLCRQHVCNGSGALILNVLGIRRICVHIRNVCKAPDRPIRSLNVASRSLEHVAHYPFHLSLLRPATRAYAFLERVQGYSPANGPTKSSR